VRGRHNAREYACFVKELDWRSIRSFAPVATKSAFRMREKHATSAGEKERKIDRARFIRAP
jgi:hypothetical protein